MEQIDDCNLFSVKRGPGRILDGVNVNEDVFESKHSDFGSFAKEDFSFVGVRRQLA